MSSFKHINANTLQSMLSDGTLQIADIRDENSYRAGHIKGAINLDNSNLQNFIESSDLDAPLVVCCYHGNSSQSASAFLNTKGFEDVYSLDGGFEFWKTAYPELVETNS